MNKPTLYIIALVLLVSANPLLARDPKPTTQQLITSLVAQLDDPAPDARQRAQDRLVDLGPDAEAAVRALGTDDNAGPEARSGAAAALLRIERNRELNASGTITASFKDAKPQDIFAEIARQANTEVLEQTPYVWTKTPKAVSLELDHEPFWRAMHKACAAMQIQPYTMMGDSGDIRVWVNDEPAKGKWTDRPFVTSGTFLVVADEVAVSRWDALRTPPSPNTQFQLDLTILPDPHLQILHRGGAILDEAIDDRGNSLIPKDSRGSGHAPGSSDAWAYNVNAYMTFPKQPGERITRISGHVPFLAVLRSEPWEMAEPLAAKEKAHQVSGRTFVVKEVKRVGNQYQASARITLPGANAEAWQRVFTQPNTQALGSWLRLVDGAGKTIARGQGGGSSSLDGRQMDFDVRFYDVPPDHQGLKLVWDVPAEVRDLEVRFEFTNLPMPK